MPQNFRRSACLSLVLVLSAGCWPSIDDGGPDEDAAVDDFPESIPEPAAGVRVIELEEQVIEPGTEVQLCYFFEPEAADLYAKALASFQGKFGHHAVLFRSVAPEPAGTIRDCTSLADMVNLIPVISSINFGLESFPENTALKVAAGTQLVVQQHYVNTGDQPIRVRDVLHLTVLPKEEVKTLAGFYGLGSVDFNLPPDGGVEQIVELSCAAPRDMNILLMGPHMHEWGKRIVTEVLRPEGPPSEVIRVDPWLAQYRDEPPVKEYSLEAPLVLKAGDVIHTTCVFDNTSDRELKFPSEMCATYGYYFPAPDGSEEWTCDGE